MTLAADTETARLRDLVARCSWQNGARQNQYAFRGYNESTLPANELAREIQRRGGKLLLDGWTYYLGNNPRFVNRRMKV